MNKEELEAVVVLRNYLLRTYNPMCKIEIDEHGVKVNATQEFIPISYIEGKLNK